MHVTFALPVWYPGSLFCICQAPPPMPVTTYEPVLTQAICDLEVLEVDANRHRRKGQRNADGSK